jgi:hypothetical protein
MKLLYTSGLKRSVENKSLMGAPQIPQQISFQCMSSSTLKTHAIENKVSSERLVMNLEGKILVIFQNLSAVQEHAVG